ncbi:MAG: hypothetical protein K5836_01910 [Clostridiales bacterium]|nr:hypothetical protein [Clostridiales bacterium]
MDKPKPKKRPLFHNRNMGVMLLMSFLLIITVMFLLSIVLPDKKISERENRTLTPFPKFSISSYFSGDFNRQIDEHYSDTFPFRDFFLNVNDKLTKLTSQFSSGSDDSIVVIQTGERDLGGEGFDDYEKAQAEAEGEVND